jgi:hypothetical protein
MRCKPDELAAIVGVPPGFQWAVGRIIRTKAAVTSSFGNPAWTYEGARIRHPIFGVEADCIEDMFLRPIRDPGEDARDETLDWLPLPGASRVEFTADIDVAA